MAEARAIAKAVPGLPITRVTHTVAIGGGLIRIHDGRTVVDFVADSIAVGVDDETCEVVQ